MSERVQVLNVPNKTGSWTEGGRVRPGFYLAQTEFNHISEKAKKYLLHDYLYGTKRKIEIVINNK